MTSKVWTIQTHFTGRIISIGYLADQLVIDVEEEVGALSIHTQHIFCIRIMDAFICAFRQNGQRIWRALEHVPFLGALRDGEGIVLISRAAEHSTKTKIAGFSRLARSGERLDFDGDIAEVVLFRLEDGCLVIGARDLNMIVLRLMVADEVIVELLFAGQPEVGIW